MTSQTETPHRAIAARVRKLRTDRGWSGRRLGEALSGVGVPWDRSIVANFENGRRPSVSVEEWLALAYVLDVAPMHLLVPPHDGYLHVLPQAPTDEPASSDAVIETASARAWISGSQPLAGTEPPAPPPMPGARREHRMVCGAVGPASAGKPPWTHTCHCDQPPAPHGAAGTPQHQCGACGATWVKIGREGT